MQNNTTTGSKKTRSPGTIAKWCRSGIGDSAQTKTVEEAQEEK